MKPAFDIRSPLLDEALIGSLRLRYSRLSKLASWLSVPAFATSLYGGYLFTTTSLKWLGPELSALNGLACVFWGLMAALALAAAWENWTQRLNSRLETFSPCEESSQEALFSLARQHPALAGYLRTVSEVRRPIYGDLVAMKNLPKPTAVSLD